jgi:hypothetical protein
MPDRDSWHGKAELSTYTDGPGRQSKKHPVEMDGGNSKVEMDGRDFKERSSRGKLSELPGH